MGISRASTPFSLGFTRIAAIFFVCVEGAALGQATFAGLGQHAGSTGSMGYGISDDGTVACGVLFFGASQQAFRWTSASGMQMLGTLPGQPQSAAYAVSADGSTIVGHSHCGSTDCGWAFRWTLAGGISDLGTLPGGSRASAYDVSADGQVVVGRCVTSNDRAFRWTSTSGMVDLTSFVAGTQTFAFGVSADGERVFGFTNCCSPWGFVYSASEGVVRAPVDGYVPLGPSANGSAVCGYVAPASEVTPAIWTMPSSIAFIAEPITGRGIARAANSNGTIVVGGMGETTTGTFPVLWFASSNLAERAFLWSTGGVTHDLSVFLPALGVDLSGWVLTQARGISADGRHLVGVGYHNGVQEAWIAHLPCPLPVDQPDAAVSCIGGSRTFSVAVAGIAPFSYQWRINGIPIDTIANPSAATATLTLTNVQPTDAGPYDCVVSNSCGSVTSSAATLSVCDYAGDTNCDAIVDLTDLATQLSNFGMQFGATRADGDANGDGAVDLTDLAMLLSLFGSGCP